MIASAIVQLVCSQAKSEEGKTDNHGLISKDLNVTLYDSNCIFDTQVLKKKMKQFEEKFVALNHF
jgi:hypothetical protein